MEAGEEKQATIVRSHSVALNTRGTESLAARGRSLVRDKEEAEEWLHKGRELQHAAREQLNKREDCLREAFLCFERGIHLAPNHPELQFMLGHCYWMGWGVAEDGRKAFHWVRSAAEQGYADAQDGLGVMFQAECDFFGVPEDHVQSTHWWRKAAEQGHATSQLFLGYNYAEGRPGVAQDYAEAAYWFRKAAEQGDSAAQLELGSLYEKGLGMPKDNEQAVSWYRKAAEQGDLTAKAALTALDPDAV